MKLDLKTLGYIKIFEKQTGVSVKDCFVDDNTIVFIVNGNIGRAIGKKGANVRILNQKFKRNIKIFEFNSDAAQFVKNLIYPTKANVELVENKVVIKTEDAKTKGFLFGRDKSKLKELQSTIKRYFKFEVVIE
jgi:N utilization substance protein A